MTDDEVLPDDWAALIKHRGYSSMRDFAEKNGVNHAVMSRGFRGVNRFTDANAKAIARGLKISTDEFWRRIDAQPSTEYSPPDIARYLTKSQRSAVDAVINAMLEGRDAAVPENVTTLRSVNQDTDLDDDTPPPIELADAARREPGYVKSGDRRENRPNE